MLILSVACDENSTNVFGLQQGIKTFQNLDTFPLHLVVSLASWVSLNFKNIIRTDINEVSVFVM